MYTGQILNEYECKNHRHSGLFSVTTVGMSSVWEELSKLLQINDDLRKKSKKKHTHRDETENWKKCDCQLVIRRVGMATNKVAMGMTVLKWMKEGIISTVGLANLK